MNSIPLSISNAAQRKRLRKHLELNGNITTTEARELLAIMHPAGRIKELRFQGLSISTEWVVFPSAKGVNHRQAKYVLLNVVDTLKANAQQ